LLPLGELRMGPEYPGPGGAFTEAVDVPVNALLLRRGRETILVDAGSGIGDPWWPGAGRLGPALVAAGCEPSTISRVILTHLDFDHAGGVFAGDWPDRLEPAFPEARVAVHGAGLAWWEARDPDAEFNVGTRVLSAFRAWGRLDVVGDREEIAPGVRLISAPGHRPGHACVAVGAQLLHLADVVHHADHIAHPAWDPAFDADPGTARATRLNWLRRAAGAGVDVVHSHVAGAGRVRESGGAFSWEPARPTVDGMRPSGDGQVTGP